jgi:hypothetical protein
MVNLWAQKSPVDEAELMVSEKIRAALEATASLIAGASGDGISTACSGKCGITPYPAASKPKPKPCAQGNTAPTEVA